MVRKGLSWPWLRCPPLRQLLFTSRVIPPILRHVRDLLQVGVVEPTSGPVFTSLLSVPEPGCSVRGYSLAIMESLGFKVNYPLFSSDANPTPTVAGQGVGHCFPKGPVVAEERQQDSSLSFLGLCLEDDDLPPVGSLSGFPKRCSRSLPPKGTTAPQAC
ncbi:hypothetical protein E2C01_038589 [Portunus trituberculatus]|uniref:Uncharacterized protein n=1 Tax=Portunus trituberculatus TaxID=210409 RepID=A0A5B7FIX9_PORTR|nr:hypothetical protein [Portunus trituberculatus]